MIKKTIDYQRCSKCLKCKKVCINGQGIDINSEGYPEFNYNCIFCGHCQSICPHSAIEFNLSKKENGFISADSKKISDEQEMILFSIRSERKFNNKIVEKEKINKVIEAMVRSLSAGNEQNRNYYILNSRKKIIDLEQKINKKSQKKLKMLKNPLVQYLMAKQIMKNKKNSNILNYDFEKLSRQEKFTVHKEALKLFSENSGYSITNNANAIIIVTSTKVKGAFHEDYYNGDVRIAITYGTILAKMIGLSSCNLGLLEMALRQTASIQKELNIPLSERIEGILALGYSENDWKQIPLRGPSKILWL